MNRYMLLIFSCLVLCSQQYVEADFFNNHDELCSSTDSYKVIKKLGRGLYGEVYAVENSQGQIFALKSYKNQGPQTIFQPLYAHAEREYLRGQAFDNRRIIKSIDFFIDHTHSDSSLNIVILELVEGILLSKIEKEVLSREKATTIAVNLCHLLKYALSQGFVYADLHLGNVMLTVDDDIRIIDLASFLNLEEYDEVCKPFKYFLPNCTDEFSLQNVNHPLVIYFDTIAEFSFKIIAKSKISREEKMNLHIEIKKLAWNYAEDLEEGKEVFITEYLNKLIETLS